MLVFFGGCGVLGYIIAWVIMPEEPLPQVCPASALGASPQAAPSR
jgi:hypothetical protein